MSAITITVLSHPLQVMLMAMVVGKLIRMALSGWVERLQGRRIAIPTLERRHVA